MNGFSKQVFSIIVDFPPILQQSWLCTWRGVRFKIKKQADPAIPQKKTRKMKYCMAPAKEISGKVAIAALNYIFAIKRAANSNARSSKWTACFLFSSLWPCSCGAHRPA